MGNSRFISLHHLPHILIVLAWCGKGLSLSKLIVNQALIPSERIHDFSQKFLINDFLKRLGIVFKVALNGPFNGDSSSGSPHSRHNGAAV